MSRSLWHDADLFPLILVGLPGAGKTTVARHLAGLLGVQVTDTDAEIRRRARATIPQIFASEGEDGFRDRETRTLRHVLTSSAAAQGVVALGGGAVIRETNREMLAGHTVIYLRAQPQTAAAHVGDGAGRPLMTAPTVSSDDEDLGVDPLVTRMNELYAARHPLYESVATFSVDTDDLTVEQIARQILERVQASDAQTSPARACGTAAGQRVSLPALPPIQTVDGCQRIRVDGAHPYEVLIGTDLSSALLQIVGTVPGRARGGVAVVYADSVADVAARYEAVLHDAGYRTLTIAVPGGESAKTVDVLADVWDRLGRGGLGRDGLVLAIGGGTTTDLAGFAAATWLRGVPVIHVPTTVLAMVDAAVGGKTGIDTSAGKNLVGAFHAPAGVLCDLSALDTLPSADIRAGLGEVVKCGLFADPVIVDLCTADPQDLMVPDSPVLAELVARSVALKAAVVANDFTETGLREILNYGHTYAHAIETATGYRWSHGRAVAVGCLYAAHVAHELGLLSAQEVALHREVLEAVGLPTSFPDGEGRWDELEAIMKRDKKVRDGRIRMVLVDGVGRPRYGVEPDAAVLRRAHDAVTSSQAAASPSGVSPIGEHDDGERAGD